MIGAAIGSTSALERSPVRAVRRRRPPRRGWRDLLWTGAVRFTDWFLRRWYRVHEFTEDPDCLIRISHTTAARPIALSDGVRVHPGDEVLDLHIWNEQLPRFFGPGADFTWAALIRRNLLRSVKSLARHLEQDQHCQSLVAVRARVTFGTRRQAAQIRRAAGRFGFEMASVGSPNRLHELGEDMLIWAFARAFNPAALRHHKLRRDRTELWISRDRLLQLHG